MSIFLESHFLPGDTAQLRLDCESVTVMASAVTVQGIETRHIEKMAWTADYRRSSRTASTTGSGWPGRP
ncbi:hypothetical protein [Cupriavidus sp. PET2-C1]